MGGTLVAESPLLGYSHVRSASSERPWTLRGISDVVIASESGAMLPELSDRLPPIAALNVADPAEVEASRLRGGREGRPGGCRADVVAMRANGSVPKGAAAVEVDDGVGAHLDWLFGLVLDGGIS